MGDGLADSPANRASGRHGRRGDFGTEKPADGLAKATSGRGPLLQLLETGLYRPGGLAQLRGVSFIEKL